MSDKELADKIMEFAKASNDYVPTGWDFDAHTGDDLFTARLAYFYGAVRQVLDVPAMMTKAYDDQGMSLPGVLRGTA